MRNDPLHNRPFQTWAHEVSEAVEARIYPDGCRDVVILWHGDRRPEVNLTPFDTAPRGASLPAGVALQGFRLRPGARLPEASLRAIAARPDAAETIIRNDLLHSDEVDQAIGILCRPGATIERAARGLGVSPRSLQRLFRGFELPPPDHWRLLARARGAVVRLAGEDPLAAIAADCGFSDQAHMTREFQRWFGRSPRQLQQDAPTRRLLAEPALGNWAAA